MECFLNVKTPPGLISLCYHDLRSSSSIDTDMKNFIIIVLAALGCWTLGAHSYTIKGGRPCGKADRSCISSCRSRPGNGTKPDIPLSSGAPYPSTSTAAMPSHSTSLHLYTSMSAHPTGLANATSAIGSISTATPTRAPASSTYDTVLTSGTGSPSKSTGRFNAGGPPSIYWTGVVTLEALWACA